MVTAAATITAIPIMVTAMTMRTDMATATAAITTTMDTRTRLMTGTRKPMWINGSSATRAAMASGARAFGK